MNWKNRPIITKTIWLAFFLGMSFYFQPVDPPALHAQTTIQPEKLLSEAIKTYRFAQAEKGEKKQRLMLKSAHLFLALSKEYRIENAKLFANAAQAFYEGGQKGKALFYFQKALRLSPLDREIKARIAAILPDNHQPSEKPDHWWEAMIGKINFVRNLSQTTYWSVLFSLYCLFWVLMGLGLWKKSRLQANLAWLSLAFMVLWGGPLCVDYLGSTGENKAVVLRAEVLPRSGPGLHYPLFNETLQEGQLLTELEEKKGWIKTSDQGEKTFWVRQSDLGRI